MSIAVAVRTANQIVLATDSKRTFGGGAVPVDNLKDVKIRRVGGAYIATTGWGVYTNILEDYLRGSRQHRLVDSNSIFAFFRNFWKALHQRYAFVNDQCSETDSPFGDLDASFPDRRSERHLLRGLRHERDRVRAVLRGRLRRGLRTRCHARAVQPEERWRGGRPQGRRRSEFARHLLRR